MKMFSDPTHHVTLFKAALDFSAFGIAGATLAGYLPPIAAALSILWAAIQITEWLIGKFKHARHRR